MCMAVVCGHGEPPEPWVVGGLLSYQSINKECALRPIAGVDCSSMMGRSQDER